MFRLMNLRLTAKNSLWNCVYRTVTNDSHCKAKYRLVMCRHGQSKWNKMNIYTGWYDTPLEEKGIAESIIAGKALKNAEFKFDIAHTSVLNRAIDTLTLMLKEMCQQDMPICKSWRLNERHYGALTGHNKADTAKIYGKKQVKLWRRSFDAPPPLMDKTHKYYDAIVKDARYANGPALEQFPMGESLKQTMERIMPYWQDVIAPQIKEGKRVLIVGHSNTLRSLVKHLDCLSDEQVYNLKQLPTAVPIIYELNAELKPVMAMKLLFKKQTK